MFRRPPAGSGRGVFWSKLAKISKHDSSMSFYPIDFKFLPLILTWYTLRLFEAFFVKINIFCFIAILIFFAFFRVVGVYLDAKISATKINIKNRFQQPERIPCKNLWLKLQANRIKTQCRIMF